MHDSLQTSESLNHTQFNLKKKNLEKQTQFVSNTLNFAKDENTSV